MQARKFTVFNYASYCKKLGMSTHRNSSLRPLDIRASLFVLECENNSVYLLCSQNASMDLEHFRQGTGSTFCQANRFTGNVLEVHLCPDNMKATAESLAEAYRGRGYTVCSEAEMSHIQLGTNVLLRRAPVRVNCHTYVLELQPLPGTDYPALYVGKSQDLTKRWANHWEGTAAKWTDRYKPVRVQRIDLDRGESYDQSRTHEDDVTLALMREMMAKHGPQAWNSVRGGRWTRMDMERPAQL